MIIGMSLELEALIHWKSFILIKKNIGRNWFEFLLLLKERRLGVGVDVG